uniref:non-specific serine/threonine protein kinase n=1 Tax=Oryza glumipatula TaxID=40148 RepID=A0A0D9YI98_9ORYZ
MSMYSVIAAGDDHPTPASSVAAEAADGGAAAGGGAAVQPAALPPLLPPPQMVVLALDATRDHREEEIRMALRAVVTRGDILRAGGDSLLVLGINVTLKVSPGSPAKFVIINEVKSSKAAWVVLDRHFRRDFKYLEKHIACKVAVFQDNLVVQPLKIIRTIPPSKSMGEVKALQHLAVSLDLRSETLDTDTHSKGVEGNMFYHYDSSERPVLCAGCGLKSVLYIKESMKFPFSEIQAATSEFSNENLLGEGGFGHVYKGQLKDGQVIAAKVRKEASSQGYTEFFSEVQVLSFARHRNIVMLLGYCCKESYNILVYEYICNKSLEWHLFDKDANLLEWHKRHAIALGIAKGLRFLHEECRAGPIIHRDLRPSNVLLTHDFVPMLGDFGLAKWKASNASIHTRILGQSGYLAPEYAEYGIVSVRTDVYAFGIVLFQLISGRKVLDECGGQCTHILQWAEPLVESLALHELIDERIAETYDTYGLYHLARAAYLCVRTNPEQRPSMGEVVRLIESENEHIRDLSRQFIPHFTK